MFIEQHAFFDCLNLKSVVVPKSVSGITEYSLGFILDEENVFTPNWRKVDPEFIIYGYTNSVAEEYALFHGINFIPIGELEVLYGDVTGDGMVDLADVILLSKYIAAPTKNYLSREQKTPLISTATEKSPCLMHFCS